MKPFIVCVAGPTATGKTEAAVAICEALTGEVVSMDSMQIYREMDIGTAKPTAKDMRGVPHHLLSFVEPCESYSAAMYQQDALEAMDGILSRGKLPVFAGGTGLYLQAVSRPLRFAEAGGASEVRAALEAEADNAALHERLSRLDPQTAARLHVNDRRRVVRALEICLMTGSPMSAAAREWEAESAQEWCIIGLNCPCETLYARIDARVDRMLARGLVDEVRGLLARGVPTSAQSMQAIGYKEIVAMLEGRCTMEETVETIKRNSRRYAKRQMTWFRRDPRVRWLDTSQYEDADALRRGMLKIIEEAHDARGD